MHIDSSPESETPTFLGSVTIAHKTHAEWSQFVGSIDSSHILDIIKQQYLSCCEKCERSKQLLVDLRPLRATKQMRARKAVCIRPYWRDLQNSIKNQQKVIFQPAKVKSKQQAFQFNPIENGTIVLEIDNVICINTTERLQNVVEDFRITQNSDLCEDKQIVHYIYLREYALKFLEHISNDYELIIYTKIEKNLATLIMKTIKDFKDTITIDIMISGSFFSKEIKVDENPFYIKSFKKLFKDRDPSKVLILDTEALSSFEYENNFFPLIPIKGEEGLKDACLLYLKNHIQNN